MWVIRRSPKASWEDLFVICQSGMSQGYRAKGPMEEGLINLSPHITSTLIYASVCKHLAKKTRDWTIVDIWERSKARERHRVLNSEAWVWNCMIQLRENTNQLTLRGTIRNMVASRLGIRDLTGARSKDGSPPTVCLGQQVGWAILRCRVSIRKTRQLATLYNAPVQAYNSGFVREVARRTIHIMVLRYTENLQLQQYRHMN